MSFGFLCAITGAYVFASALLLRDGRPDLALAYLGWAIGNVGLLWDVWK